jgi:drug/metabolite transporter (DMT)-like permease
VAQDQNSFLWGIWSDMGISEWTAMALLAAAVVIGSVGSAVAFQLAPSAVLAPFNFAYVAFAALWGVLLFQE